jgi:hypothetical protein
MLNDWYVKHHRLPRKKDELLLAGFDESVVAEFDSRHFREEIKALAKKLYDTTEDHDALSLEFIQYIHKIDLRGKSMGQKVKEYVQNLF